uniref:Uncharacterized protein n=1 Tax=Corynebacterium silvaticum TaxID=2320431 RepID=A0A7U5K8U6_9CORY
MRGAVGRGDLHKVTHHLQNTQIPSSQAYLKQINRREFSDLPLNAIFSAPNSPRWWIPDYQEPDTQKDLEKNFFLLKVLLIAKR